MTRNSTFALFAVVAAGCSHLPSVGPDYEEPALAPALDELPDAGQPTDRLAASGDYIPAEGEADLRKVLSSESLVRWWERFNDPVLNDLVEGALTNNLGYCMALSRLDQANWELLGSGAAFLPKFSARGAWNRNWFHEDTRSAGGVDTRYNLASAGLDGNWEIDIFGGNRRLVESALAQAEAAKWTAEDAWVSLTTQIGAQYVSLRTTQELIEVARTNLVLQSETYEILKSRQESGIGDALAVNQCAYVVEQTRARLPQMLAQEEEIMNSLAILAGETPGSLHERLRRPDTARDWLVEPVRLGEMPLDLIRLRPDVRAAERALAAQTARIGVAESSWFPKFFISGSVGFENNHSTKLFKKESFLASLGPAVSWPIFQGGAIYANVKVQEAKTAELADAYALAVDTACSQVRSAYSAYTLEYHRQQALKAAVKAASDALQISQDLYKNGLRDFNNVLDAQRSRLQLEEEAVVSRGRITSDLIDLYRALGGGAAR